jgi:hypothetical protein
MTIRNNTTDAPQKAMVNVMYKVGKISLKANYEFEYELYMISLI